MPVPLTKINTGKLEYKWTKIKQYYFEEIKWIVVCDILLAYPAFNEEFNIHTNAIKFQLGAVIIHVEKPIVFYSIKPTGAHKRYTVTKN